MLRTIFIALIGIFLLSGTDAFGQESDFSCMTGSGDWQYTNGHLNARALLCRKSDDECPDLYNLYFGENRVLFAQKASVMDACELRYVAVWENKAIFHDWKRIYIYDPDTLKLELLFELANIQDFVRDRAGMVFNNGKGLYLLRKTTDSFVLDTLSEEKDLERLDTREQRLLAIKKDRMIWWERNEFGQLSEAKSMVLDPPLVDGQYRIDNNALVVTQENAQRIYSYNFHGAERFTSRMNATAFVRFLGGSHSDTMVINTDANVTRVMGRLGSGLQNRYEAKYWKLTEADSANGRALLLSDGNSMVLDGGIHGKRVAFIDTSEITWKRIALLEFKSDVRLGALKGSRLVTLHDNSDLPLRVWNVRNGDSVAVVSRAKLSEAGLGDIVSVTSLASVFLLRDTQHRIAFLSLPEAHLSQAFEDPQRFKEKYTVVTPDGFIVLPAETHDDYADEHIVLDPKLAIVSRHKLADFVAKSEKREALEPYAKWYGYCIDAIGLCLSKDAQILDNFVNEQIIWNVYQSANDKHSPIWPVYLIALLSVLAAIVITCWRLGVGKNARVVVTSEEDGQESEEVLAGSGVFMLMDKRGRRFVTSRDKQGYLHRSFLTLLPVRLLVTFILSVAIAYRVVYYYFYDAPFYIMMTWLTLIALPVAAFIWTLISWRFWNRHYLLLFGRATVGEWHDAGTIKQSVTYSPADDKVFRLKRGQWQKADLIPIILFDPRKSGFCTQYTGSGSFPILPSRNARSKARNASTDDYFRMLPTLLILLIIVASSFFLFYRAFPYPISVRQIEILEASAEKNNTEFISACLAYCDSDDCVEQCNKLQLRIIFRQSGIMYKNEPQTTPKAILGDQYERLKNVLAILRSTDADCNDLSTKLKAIPVWTHAFRKTFNRVYNDNSAYTTAAFKELSEKIKKESDYIKSLCSKGHDCAKNLNCPTPPVCMNDNTDLKNELCTLYNTLRTDALN